MSEEKVDILRQLLLNRQKFGTAGIRGVMRAGYNSMNDLVIIQTTQGLCQYLVQHYGLEVLKKNGVVIGFDGRHNSKRFAKLSSAVFIQKNISVYLFDTIVPTPFIPFGIKTLKSMAGIMITASHNPKEDNGYKVYFANGSQIIGPHDANIQKCIEENLEPWPGSWSLAALDQVINPMKHVSTEYYKSIKKRIVDAEIIKNTDLRFTYTSLHGVGHEYLTQALTLCGFPSFFPTEEQMRPDPEFPTVTFPNPEEGKGVLNLAIKTANFNSSTIILANDPDADRCAVAEKKPLDPDEVNGPESEAIESWRIFNGNEIGALLGWWLWHKHKDLFRDKTSASDCYMMSSSVSSKILETMASKEGFNFIETLTGFKWMGNKSWDLTVGTNNQKKVLFAFEEAIGFMCGTDVLDKDGISAAIEVAQLAAYVKAEFGYTLADQLNHIYMKYGYHTSLNSYFICHEKKTIDKIFKRLSSFDGNEGTYPKSIGPYLVKRVRDLNRGYDSLTGEPVSLIFCR